MLHKGCTQTYLFKTSAEPFKHSLHVSSFLHGNDPSVILFIDPDQEVLLVVMPKTVRKAELVFYISQLNYM